MEIFARPDGQPTVYDVSTYIYRNVFVRTGGHLIIKTDIFMGDDNRIEVERGAKLEVIEGRITNACEGEPWRGIFVHGNVTKDQPDPTLNPSNPSNPSAILAPDDSGIVFLRGATLEYADAAIRTDVFSSSYSYRIERWGGLIDAEDTQFKNNRVGVGFMRYERPNKSRFINCIFEETEDQAFPIANTFGMTIWRCEEISFKSTIFQNLDRIGIYSENSGFNVSNKSEFRYMQIGIRAISSTLLNPTIRIRGINSDGISSDQYNNIFIGNDIHIQLRGLGDTYGCIISHNKFLNGNIGVQSSLFSATGVGRNFFSGTKNPINFNNNFSARVAASCNKFKGGCIGVLVRGENFGINETTGNDTGFYFDGNDYNQFSGIGLKLTDLAESGTPFVWQGYIPNIGTGGFFNAAENCFTEEILAEVITEGDTRLFDYIYNNNSDADECFEVMFRFNIPNNTNNFRIGGGFTFQDPCLSDINLVINLSALQEVREDLQYYENQLNIEPDNEQHQAYHKKYFNLKEEILKGLLEIKLKNKEYNQAENLLIEESTERQLKWGYNIKLLAKDYEGAAAKLNQLNTNDLENLNFVKTQEVVLAIETSTTAFTLSPQQVTDLSTIANGLGKSSGHAMTLLERYSENYEAPLFDQCLTADCNCEAEEKEEFDSELDSKLDNTFKVYPNPANKTLNIEYDSSNDNLKTVRIFTIDGKLISSLAMSKSGFKNIDIEAFPSGIYLITVDENGKTIFQDKFTIVRH